MASEAMACARFSRFFLGFTSLIIMSFVSTNYADDANALLFPFGSEEGDSFLAPNDDGSSGEIPISTYFPFFDHNHESLYVNTNGAISFLIGVPQYTPSPFPLAGDRRLVAVFWGDVDIRLGGQVMYREVFRQTGNQVLFEQADTIIRRAFVQQSKFTASWMFVATWDQVPFYGASSEGLKITNTFQAVLVTDGKRSFAIYNFKEIRWTTGTASGGSSSNGLGGTPAQVGFNAGDGFTYFAVSESRTPAIIDIDQDSNSGTRGRFVFQIDNNVVDSGCTSDGALVAFPLASSMLGGDIIDIQGPCLNETSSIVCRFAGNEVTGKILANRTTVARCVSPPVFQIGRLPLSLSTDGGRSFPFNGIFRYLSPEDTFHLVQRRDGTNWHRRSPLTITWPTDIFQDVKLVNIHVYAYVEDLDSGDVKLQLIHDLTRWQTVPYEVGLFRFSRPESPSGVEYTAGVIRVSIQGPGQENNNVPNWLDLPGIWSDIHNLQWLFPIQDPLLWCQRWMETEISLNLEFLTMTEPCPCTLTQALVDAGRFTQHPLCSSESTCHLHRPGAKYCVRTNNPSGFGGGQECCYDNNDNVVNAAQSRGGGFAQRRHHRGSPPYKVAGRVPFFSNWIADVMPMENCCVFDDKACDNYVTVRPSQTCENYVPPAPALVTGDPHLITLDGVKYTFNGVGEYTMLETCDGNFTLQVRMSVLEAGQRATVITAVAGLQRTVSDQIHVQVSERRGVDVWFRQDSNNSVWSMLEFDETQIRRVDLEGVTVIFRMSNNSNEIGEKTVLLNFQCGVSLVVSTTSGLLSVMPTLQRELRNQTRGLIGNWNGDPGDDLQDPEGVVLSSNVSMEKIHHEFGKKWQIQPENSLFMYPLGKGPDDFVDESFQPIFLSLDDGVVNGTVREVCGSDTQCAFDLIVTGNREIAVATKGAVAEYTVAVESAAIVTCGALPVPLDGKREISRSNVGGIAIFTCNVGYSMVGSSELECQANGQWSGEAPTCIRDDQPVFPADGLKWWQVALIVCGSVVLTAAVVVTVVVVVKRRKN